MSSLNGSELRALAERLRALEARLAAVERAVLELLAQRTDELRRRRAA